MAEGLFRLAAAGRDEMTVSSCGIAASKGAPASKETLAILKNRGASLEGFKSRPVSEAILSTATHVFVMTEDHLAALEARFPQHSGKYFLIREFSGIRERREGIDVPDPIGMGQPAYEEVAKILEAAMVSVIAYVEQDGGCPGFESKRLA